MDAWTSSAVDARKPRLIRSKTQVHDLFDQVRRRASEGSSGVSTPTRQIDNGPATRPANNETRSIVSVHLPGSDSPPGDRSLPTMRIDEGVESRMQQAGDRWLDQQTNAAGDDGRADFLAAQLTSAMFALPRESNCALMPQYDSPVPTLPSVRNVHN